ncbi:MAG: GntR family transcriptional regulator [Rhodospirillaceae bacterium]|nr:GntR family transcriptional regulator [Rhodospirillaceae bacterium]
MPKGAPAIAQAKSLPDIVYDHLREEILSGRIGPGEPIRQEHLAARLGVSRAPVREALKALEGEGLIIFRPRRGYLVTALDPDEIEEIFEIRALLEERGGTLAAKFRTQEDIEAVGDLLEQMEAIKRPTPASIARWAALNREFHTRLFQSSRKEHLCHMTMVLRDTVERYVRLDAATQGRVADAESDHRMIFDAFCRGDADATGRLSREHCEHTCERLVRSLRTRKD